MTAAATEAAAPTTSVRPTMEERIAAELAADPMGHEWLVAAYVKVDTKTARRADFRGSFRTHEGQRIEAMETICGLCRRPMDDLLEEPECSAKIDNQHLIGGDQSTREKRIKHDPVGQVIRPTGIARRQMQYGGYSTTQGK